ncbi:S41 family peptidase [Tepidanaerobacter syntrophicus]|uniref:Carboxyl-terminal processing protease n=1 Tax=Tepidanaerobacter syntrophicus TaxID=224999 RepID=A0A0U9HNV2_9FIRM|nr:S41 family peptidase [Tepidanaerobacter syntrophicus]GAQ25775.1 carboxyl-terminal processing protease [Tepidanaerobacter syntrophicus]GLI20143.1 peptidase S41 [Tepidanaerobacter syntrophicus]
MRKNNWKHISRIAILCLAISLFSFFIGTTVGGKQLREVNAKNDASTLLTQVKDEHDSQDLKAVSEVIQIVKDKYIKDVEMETLTSGAIKGVIDSLGDPYSVFMNKKEFQDFISSLEGSLSGVGIVLGIDDSTQDIIVVSPIKGSPAQKAGILPGDIIVKVNDTELSGKTLDEAAGMIRGEKGTKVTLYIKRNQNSDLIKLELVRDDIRISTVDYNIVDDAAKIGYIRISFFDSQTYNDFKIALDALQKQKIRGLVIDLRDNPGGSLDETVKIADEILGEGLIVYTEGKNGNRLGEYFSDESKTSVPITVMVNENSASASEILAGAIQDHKAGKLVGAKTFGKGSVQEVFSLEDGSGMKITIAKYYLPSGRCIDGKGIEPDFSVKNPEGSNSFDLSKEKDAQLLKAIEVTKSLFDVK